MACYHNDEYHYLLVEDVIDSVAYGICVTAIVNIARTTLFPPPSINTTSIPSKRKRGFLFTYAFALVALASLFYLPSIIGRAAASGSWFPLPAPHSPEEGRALLERVRGWKLWNPERSAWARNAWIPFEINDALASILLEYLIYLSWRSNAYVIGATIVLLFMRLVGSPLLFEIVLLTLSIIRLVFLKRRCSSSFGLPGPNKLDHEEPNPDEPKVPSAILVLIVTAIFALTTYTDVILHMSGVVGRERVEFIKTVVFFGAFIVQVIVITYWAEGGPMCIKKEGGIKLPGEPEQPDEGGSEL